MDESKEEEFTRRKALTAIGLVGGVSTTSLMLVDYSNDFEVESRSIQNGGYFVEVGATESGSLQSILPYSGPLSLTCWVDSVAVDNYPHASVESVAPDGKIENRQAVSNPTPTELLRSEKFYRVETAEVPGDHSLRLVDRDGTVIESAVITIRKR